MDGTEYPTSKAVVQSLASYFKILQDYHFTKYSNYFCDLFVNAIHILTNYVMKETSA